MCVIRNHTTYYLSLDAHVHTAVPPDLLEQKLLLPLQRRKFFCISDLMHLQILTTTKPGNCFKVAGGLCIFYVVAHHHLKKSLRTTAVASSKSALSSPQWQRPTESSLGCRLRHKIGSTGLWQVVRASYETQSQVILMSPSLCGWDQIR